MSGDRRPSPPPLEANEKLVTAILAGAWAVALVVMLALGDRIAPAQRWWVWTCATGLGMGLFGLWYVPHMKRRRAQAAARREAAGQARGSKSVSSTDTPGRSTRS